ncbi:hypothetical protein [Streptomyces lincolnensis]|uniref:hypothetical protein n=1 Tax=Streptomyces lincolnensis TaxID=1915 RepID=UPI000829D380|nr:hypothetical protein [Streptomyces lincolnensis]QMV08569.1 hypothetical protein GJU35_24970 [Streptomyces lincolnensis]
MNERELIERVRDRPGMFGLNGFYYPTVTFLDGYDLGRSGALLQGFTEWLIARKGKETSLGWRALVLEEVFPDSGIRHWSSLTEDQQQPAVDHLFALLLDFLDEREAR